MLLQCSLVWVDCDVVIYKPQFEPVNSVALQEAQEYTHHLTLSQGTPPLTWTLLSGPDNLTLDQASGEITWNRARAGNHTVSIQVENQVGIAKVAWTLEVEAGYSAFLSTVSPNLSPKAQPVLLTGHVDYVAGNVIEEVLAGVVSVHVDICSGGATRTLNTFSNADGNFSVMFYPAAKEYGTYVVGARHPSSLQSVPQTEFVFVGMKSTPSTIVLTAENQLENF